MSDQENHQTPSASTASVDPVAAALELTPLIRAHADETERGRRLAAPVVNALRSARLFAMGLPASLGGSETPIETVLHTIEQIAYADGATGWNVMIAFDTGFMTGFLHEPQARALIASIRLPIVAGSISPPGRLVRTAGGYRLSGRWRFGSGCQQADLFVLGAMPDGEGIQVGTNLMHDMLWVTVPAAQVTILDTWRVAGLRGTGSYDFTVEDLFVAEGFAEPVHVNAAAEPGPLYALGVFPAFGIVKAAVALGSPDNRVSR